MAARQRSPPDENSHRPGMLAAQAAHPNLNLSQASRHLAVQQERARERERESTRACTLSCSLPFT